MFLLSVPILDTLQKKTSLVNVDNPIPKAYFGLVSTPSSLFTVPAGAVLPRDKRNFHGSALNVSNQIWPLPVQSTTQSLWRFQYQPSSGPSETAIFEEELTRRWAEDNRLLACVPHCHVSWIYIYIYIYISLFIYLFIYLFMYLLIYLFMFIYFYLFIVWLIDWLIYILQLHAWIIMPTHSIARYLEWLKILNRLLY